MPRKKTQSKPVDAPETERKAAIRELWYRGVLRYKLHPVQLKMLNSYIQQNNEITVIACARRSGKSVLLCLLAIETCLKKPNSIVKYVCPRKNMVKTILQPAMNLLLEDCPPELKPEFRYNSFTYDFPNGSQIQMAGTDNGHHENLRGGSANLWIVDEAGFCDELTYVVKTILAPTADTTGGRGIIASTPSKLPDHDFIVEFMKPYEYSGDLIKYTVHDNPLLTKPKIREIISRYRLGEKDPEFRREYMCEVVQSTDTAVIPEFDEETQAAIVKEWPRPPFIDAYVSMDIGGKDMTFLVFAYYDFKNGIIVVEDELAVPGKEVRLDKLAKDIKKKEEALYTNSISGEFKPPYLRVADNNNLILLNDLNTQHGIVFLPTRKDDRTAALNTMRMKIADKKILIHPRCEKLIYHLKNASWKKNKKDFERLGDGSHADGLAALMYLVRNIHEHKNPYPRGYGLGKMSEMFNSGMDKLTPSQEKWKQIFSSNKKSKK